MTEQLNADFAERVEMHTAEMDWQPSPSGTVWRKRLELSGPAEAGRVTSVVRYEPDSRFPAHPHPDGEEIFVLDGVFSDESGDYPAGTFLLNPEGFEHAPRSRDGCVLFVKLRQYPGTDRKHVVVDTNALAWQPTDIPGVFFKPLYEEAGHPERISLIRFDAGAAFPEHDHPAGEEIFLISGDLRDGERRLGPGSWVRYPPGSRHAPMSEKGCVFYVKSGHLAAS